MAKKHTPKRPYLYKDLVLEVMDEHYSYETHTGFSVTQIAELVIKKICEKNRNMRAMEVKDIYSSIFRAVKRLESEKQLLCRKKRYAPYNLRFARNIYIDNIVKQVDFLNDQIFEINRKMVALKISNLTMNTAAGLFELYLGENCYAILKNDNVLILMLQGTDEDRTLLTDDIKKVAREGYILSQQANKKRLKKLKKKEDIY